MCKTYTHEEFLAKLKIKSPGVIALSEYKGVKNPVDVMCEKCGRKWTTRADNLFSGCGCKVCKGMLEEYTQEIFVKRMKTINPTIDILSEYKNSITKVSLKCNVCGNTWLATPNSLLSGHGCNVCNKYIRLTHSEFVNKSAMLHPNIEIISEYKTLKSIISCRCLIHDRVINIAPDRLIANKFVCSECADEYYLSARKQRFEKRLNNASSNIMVIGTYASTLDKTLVRCNTCGYVYYDKPEYILNKNSCPACYKHPKSKTTVEFAIEMSKINKDIIITGEYVGAHSYISFRCNACGRHGVSTPSRLLMREYGCKNCTRSIGEMAISRALDNIGIDYEEQKRFYDLRGAAGKKLSFDFYISSISLLIEYQGEQHDRPVPFDKSGKKFTNLERQQENDQKKRNYAECNNYVLLEIWYYDKKNIETILENKIEELNISKRIGMYNA